MTELRVLMPTDRDHYLVCTGPHAAGTAWPPQGAVVGGRGEAWPEVVVIEKMLEGDR